MCKTRIASTAICCLLHLLALVGLAQGTTENVLISIPKPYDRVVAGIRSLGGTVNHQFTYVNGIAAEIPTSAMAAVRKLVGNNAISKDELVAHPVAADIARGKSVGGKQFGPVHGVQFRSAKPVPETALASFATTRANSYVINGAGVALPSLHSQGITGSGVIVAVIDSGMRPGFPALELDNSVIEGKDFVGDGFGVSNSGNDPHGTFVASLISANAEFDLTGNPTLLNAIKAYAPSALFNGNSIALVGSAPASKIYPLRVFGPDITLGAPESRIIAAIQHVIDKRKEYDQGGPNGLKIEVCNLSLGNTTFAAGRDLFDQSADALLAAGIIPVISAGNAGPSTLTIASPGGSFTSLTVGAASFAANERIVQEIALGPGGGAMWRPFSGTQTAFFSSRGPNADGRLDPDVVASGFDNIGQGYFTTSELSFASGTSFAAPIVSGIAAMLRQAFPNADPIEIRNAIIASGRKDAISDGSTDLDRGQGLVSAQIAYQLLAQHRVSDELPPIDTPSQSVKINVQRTNLLNVQNGSVKETFRDLKPGQRRDILYQIGDHVDQLTLKLENVTPALPPAQQNQLFGDDILLYVHSSKTSSIHESGDYLVAAFTLGGTFILNDLEPGILRVSVTGDWTNAGTISADVGITSSKSPLPKTTANGVIADSELLFIPLDIPPNVKVAEFRLAWSRDWGSYPTNDVDMILFDPVLNTITTGASLNHPEKVTVTNPAAGTWFALINGFDVTTGTDKFRLNVILDGKPLNNPPAANAGADLNQQCSGVVTLNGSATDADFGDSLTFKWTSPSISGTLSGETVKVNLPFGTHVFTLEVSDSTGMSTTDTVVVKIQDTEAPAFTFVPANMLVAAASANITRATASDNCGGPVTISNNAPATYPVGPTTVTWTARDTANNEATATTVVTYESGTDKVKPSCAISATIAGPPKQIIVTVQDADSGVASINVVVGKNLTTVIPAFNPGTRSAIVVTATKTNASQPSQLVLSVKDVAGNQTECP